jgi:hypothetical protein
MGRLPFDVPPQKVINYTHMRGKMTGERKKKKI